LGEFNANDLLKKAVILIRGGGLSLPASHFSIPFTDRAVCNVNTEGNF